MILSSDRARPIAALSSYCVRAVAALAVSSVVAACASNPDKIKAAYVSTIQYEKYDCDQLGMETMHVERNVNDLYASLKTKSDNDAWQMGVGMVLLWPMLFTLEGGDGPDAAEYARMKGEYEALRQVSITKKCNIAFKKDLSEVVKANNPEDGKKKPSRNRNGKPETTAADEKLAGEKLASEIKPNADGTVGPNAVSPSLVAAFDQAKTGNKLFRVASMSGAPAFAAPSAEGKPVHTFANGAQLTVLEAVQDNRWYRVVTPDGSSAYVPSATVKSD
jgi:hypothetical protein